MFASPEHRPAEEKVEVHPSRQDYFRPQLSPRASGSIAPNRAKSGDQRNALDDSSTKRRRSLAESPAKRFKRLADALPRWPDSVKRPLGHLFPSPPRKRRPSPSDFAVIDSDTLSGCARQRLGRQQPLSGSQTWQDAPFSPIPVRPHGDLPAYLDSHAQRYYAASSIAFDPMPSVDEQPPDNSFSQLEPRQARPSGLVGRQDHTDAPELHFHYPGMKHGRQEASASPTQAPVQAKSPSVFVLPNPARPYPAFHHAHPDLSPRSSPLSLSRTASSLSRAPSPARSAVSHSSGLTAPASRYNYSPANSNWSLSVSTSWSVDSPSFQDPVDVEPAADRPRAARTFSDAVRALDELVDTALGAE
ncbi:hypothetical protein BMF94_1347 [Rhodotorula taiwanensis]|uniref:Uncharacterized protein n=1 Tax=Rhodotorula taiwanensis TaxID=741276 RepID=A0A2S5BG30_9BASI|nr:hypothetical protein BMF94_1347 [Rhodotorula taiwanensis]